MANHSNQLGIPPGPADDAQAFELARVWSSQGHQYYVLHVEPFRDQPAVWGLMALDLMKHAARAYEQLDGRSREDAYREMLFGIMAEMQNPTEPL
jgi:hypothetical protein